MLIYDLETDGFIEEAEVIHCCHILDTDHPELGVQRYNDHGYKAAGTVAAGVERLGKAEAVLAHNGIAFDYHILDKLYPEWDKGVKRLDSIVATSVIWTDLKKKDFACRESGHWKMFGRRIPFPKKFAGKRGALYGSHSLQAWGMRLGEFKGDFDPADYGKTWKTIGWTEEMDDYCVQDVVVTARLVELIESKNYSQTCLDLEHGFKRIINRQERHGFLLDMPKAEKLHNTLLKRRAELEAELHEIFRPWYVPDGPSKIAPERGIEGEVVNRHELARGYRKPKVNNGPRGETKGVPFTKLKHVTFNPGSTDHIGQRLQALYGWEPELYGADGKPTCDDDVLSTLKFGCMPAIREYLVVSKRLGQLAEGNQAILKKVHKDGRIHGRVDTNGASTGRCTHSQPNVAQTPKVGKPYGAEFRELYTVPPGFKLVGADASGIELRVMSHYMAAYDGGEYAREVVEGDAHWVNLRSIGVADCPRDPDNIQHKKARDAGKTWVYAKIYGCGVELSGIHYNAAYELFHGKPPTGTITGNGRKSRKALMDNLPALKLLEDAVKKKAQRQGWIKGLDGRRITIRSQHSALNALFQSAGAIIMKKALCILDEALQKEGLAPGVDYEFVANVHDEWQVEVRDIDDCPQRVADLSCEAFTLAGEFFDMRVRIDGEADIGHNWKETH